MRTGAVIARAVRPSTVAATSQPQAAFPHLRRGRCPGRGARTSTSSSGDRGHSRHGYSLDEAEPGGFLLDLRMPLGSKLQSAGEAAFFDLANRVGDPRTGLRLNENAVEEPHGNGRKEQTHVTGPALEARVVDGRQEALERLRERSVQPVGRRLRRCNQDVQTLTRARRLPPTALYTFSNGALAQLGERRLCKPEVTGSIPVRSIAVAISLCALPSRARGRGACPISALNVSAAARGGTARR